MDGRGWHQIGGFSLTPIKIHMESRKNPICTGLNTKFSLYMTGNATNLGEGHTALGNATLMSSLPTHSHPMKTEQLNN